MKEAKKAVRGSGRVSFLARMDAIKKMIEEGHPLLSIYQEYEKDFGFSYSQFVKYVHKFIRRKPEERAEGNRTEATAKVSSSRQSRDSALENLKLPTNKEDIV